MTSAALDTFASEVPPEWWEKKRDYFKQRATDSAWFAKMLRIRGIVTWGGIAAVLLVAIVLPEILAGLKVTLWSMLALVTMFLLVRTKTIRWSSTAAMFTVGAMWAYAIVAISYIAVGIGGLEVDADGPSIAVAAFFEEALKLTPVLVVAVIAPGRVRRFALADWLLIGYACGMGFNAAEDGAREFLYAIEPLTPFQELFGASRSSRTYGLNPFVAGNYDIGTAASPGHQIYTGLAATGIGLAVTLWRRSGATSGRVLLRRVGALAVGTALFLVPVSGHAGFNASLRASNFADVEGVGYPSVMALLWNFSDSGRRQIVWFVLLLLLCTILDGKRRADVRAAQHQSAVKPESGRSPLDVVQKHDEYAAARRGEARFASAHGSSTELIRKLAPHVQVVAGYACAIVAAIRNDLRVLLSYARLDDAEDRSQAIQRGRSAVEQQRMLREQIMTASIGGREPESRQRFGRTSLAFGVGGTAVCLVLGVFVAQAIGPDLTSRADGFGPLAPDLDYFANLFHALGDWWNSQGFLTQMALMIGIAALIAFTGGSFWWAFWATGIADLALRKHEGVATFADDPVAATTHYVQTTTPQQALFGAVEVVLTTMLPSAGGAATGAVAREAVESAARETAESAARETAESAARETAEQSAREAAEDAAGQGAREGAETAAGHVDLGLRMPSGRHSLTGVRQGTVAKNLNTVIEPGVDVAADVRLINSGQAVQDGQNFIANGRTYGAHDGTLYPIAGPGLHQLTRQEFKVLGLFNQLADAGRAEQIAREAFGATDETIERVVALLEVGGSG